LCVILQELANCVERLENKLSIWYTKYQSNFVIRVGEDMLKQILAGDKGHEKSFLVKDNTLYAEILNDGSICRIKFRKFVSPDGKTKRYYIERGGYIIGWVNQDLSDYCGKSVQQQDMLHDILSAMKAANYVNDKPVN